MKSCSVCGSPEEHFDGSDCVGHLKTEIRRLNKELTLSEDRYHAKRREVRNAESRLRDAEAREGELVRRLKWFVDRGHVIQAKFDLHGPPDMAEALKVNVGLSKKSIFHQTAGAFDRLRNEVLEEAAGIIKAEAREVLLDRDTVLHLLGVIRAAKKVDQ